MRGFFFAIAALSVIGLAYWAYTENYATQDATKRVARLQRDIGEARAQLNVLRAEWAYLNRPDRLRELVDLNYDALQLMPLAPEHFGTVKMVSAPRFDPTELSEPVDLMANFDDLASQLPPDGASE
jgi:cell division protein FtsL